MSTSTNSNTLIIAGAVVFAGLLIAAGIFFGNSSGSENSTATSNDGVIAAAEVAGVDSDAFRSCIESTDFQSDVEEDVNDAAQAGGGGTPFNVLVINDPLTESSQTEIIDLINSPDLLSISQDGKRVSISGAIPFPAMTQIIDIIQADASSEGSETPNSDDIAINPVDEDDHIRGSLDAEIIVVEYSDFLCPFCGQFHLTMKSIIESYDENQVAWVYRQFPIPQLHPQAPRYAQASECIADIEGNEAFWDYADAVFESQQ
ncbi:MAG: thioredoxin domain-containing protein [Candidatus Paceibacterota bacterium]